MLFFLGGSVGAAALIGFSTSGNWSLNPLHTGVAAGYSNGLLFLLIPMMGVLYLTATLPLPVRRDEASKKTEPAKRTEHYWTADCSLPWAPEAELSRRPAGLSRT